MEIKIPSKFFLKILYLKLIMVPIRVLKYHSFSSSITFSTSSRLECKIQFYILLSSSSAIESSTILRMGILGPLTNDEILSFLYLDFSIEKTNSIGL